MFQEVESEKQEAELEHIHFYTKPLHCWGGLAIQAETH